jgi:hypothetical protein
MSDTRVDFEYGPNAQESGIQDLAIGLLPPGTHPNDPSVPMENVDQNDLTGMGVTKDVPGNRFITAPKQFSTSPGSALGVFQRASDAWSAQYYTVGQAQQVVGRQPGRVAVSLWVPSTATEGINIAPSIGEAQALDGGLNLNPGDSITIETEAPVWISPITGQALGYCNVVVTFNPEGGVLGNL